MMSGDVLSTDSSARQPQEHIGNLVAIRPGRTLVFNVDSPIKRMARNITIRNISSFPVTYKIKTTSREGYRVKPHTGLLEAGQSADTVITLLPHNQYRVSQDKFLVMAARASSKLKAKDRRKLDSFWKKVSKDKFGTDYMEHQLGCALNVDEYLANQDENISATDSEVDHRFKDENVMGDDYITPESSVLLRQTPVEKTPNEPPYSEQLDDVQPQDFAQLERSSADYVRSVSPQPAASSSLDYIRPTLRANAQESVAPEDKLSVADTSQPVVSEDKMDSNDAEDEISKSDTFLKKESAFCDNKMDADGREKRVKRMFKSIIKKKRRSGPPPKPPEVVPPPQKKVKVVEPTMKELMNASIHLPKMFTKVKTYTAPDDSSHISADEVVISLKKTEDVLNRHITCFKGFQVFVVVAICALCIIIIVLMVNFPSAVSIRKTNS